MTKTLTWLLAGAALTLSGGAALAGDPLDAEREAAADAKAAPAHERHEVRAYRDAGDGPPATPMHGAWRGDHLSAILQLRPEQEPALKAFLEVVRPTGEDDHFARFDRDADGRTTPQRLDNMQARMAERQAVMARRIAAVRTFYAQLDDKQKKAFDAMPLLMMVGPGVGPMIAPHPMPIMRRVPQPLAPPALPERPDL